MQQQARFVGSVVIVTGAGRGIGRAISERFGSEGARVVVNDIGPQADEVALAVTQAGGEELGVVADVSQKREVDRLFDTALDRFGDVNVLVNNAGLTNESRHFLEGDEAWWDRVLDTNLKSVFLCAHRAAWLMARRNGGSIINLSSGGATRAHRGNAAYDASKGGIEAFTRAAAVDLAPYAIRVNAIAPGVHPHRTDDRRGRTVTRQNHSAGPHRPAGGDRRRGSLSRVRRRALHHRANHRRGWWTVVAAALPSGRHFSAGPLSPVEKEKRA